MNALLLPTRPTTCALCGQAGGSILAYDSVPGLTNLFTLVRCARCGLIRVNPAPTDDALRRYYQDYHRHMAAPGRRIVTGPEAEARAASDIADLERWRAPGRLLDIGCGQGHLLRAAARRGWQVFGTEVSDSALAALRQQFGPDRIWAALPQDHAAAPFDAIVMRHVLEHLLDPPAALRQVRQLLAPGGVLLCEVPDACSLRSRLRSRPLSGQLHLWHFNAATLPALLSAVGLRPLEVSFRDHRGPARNPVRRVARRIRFALENLAWRWARIDLGTNLRVYAARRS